MELKLLLRHLLLDRDRLEKLVNEPPLTKNKRIIVELLSMNDEVILELFLNSWMKHEFGVAIHPKYAVLPKSFVKMTSEDLWKLYSGGMKRLT